MKEEKLAIRLADGSVSSKQCGSICVAIQARNSKIVILDFFVLGGLNNCLGRWALEKIWPTQYKALKDIATEVSVIASSAKFVSSSCTSDPVTATTPATKPR